MRAMVLAAGIGSRLRPLTDTCPKPLLDLGGRVTMLELVLKRLKSAGVTEVIINTHHHADMVAAFLRKKDFGLRTEISHEPELLDTGGGLKQAGWFFTGTEPFILHNADILSDIDLSALLRKHERDESLATLAVSSRQSSRRFVFDAQSRLCGHLTPQAMRWAGEPRENTAALAFNGIHAISPRLLGLITETGVFSINDVYLRLAACGERIGYMDCSASNWLDIGKPDSFARAGEIIKHSAF